MGSEGMAAGVKAQPPADYARFAADAAVGAAIVRTQCCLAAHDA